MNPRFPPNFLMIENCLFLFPISLIYSHHSNHVSRVKRDPQIPFLTCPNGNRDPRIIVYEKCGPVGAKSKGMHENWNFWNLLAPSVGKISGEATASFLPNLKTETDFAGCTWSNSPIPLERRAASSAWSGTTCSPSRRPASSPWRPTRDPVQYKTGSAAGALASFIYHT